MIPKGLTETHILEAAARIDRDGVAAGRDSRHYDLLLDGRRYPPKYVISIAGGLASGEEYPASEFNAVEAKNYFISHGYEVIDRRAEAATIVVAEDDESAFPEGRVRYANHRRLERDSSITRKAKAKRLAETDVLCCEVCEMDFVQTYGEIGIGFIEAHHKKPVAELDGSEKTKISDLALVCSNCHRMLHRSIPLLSVAELKTIHDQQKRRS